MKNPEIYFVTGKGGVGKSAVAAALAWHYASRGELTLLVELGDFSRYQETFAIQDVEAQPSGLVRDLDIAIWSGSTCLREYALHMLKLESLYRLFFENPVSRTLINIAPALNELAIAGKITSGPPRKVGPPLNYDKIVVDGYASGHFMAFLRAPVGMRKVIPFGPMGEQSKQIQNVLMNPAICKYKIVALPEELPVIEGLELEEKLKSEFGIQSEFILNKVFPRVETVGACSRAFEAELRRQAEQADSARRKMAPKKIQEIAFQFQNMDRAGIAQMSQDFAK